MDFESLFSPWRPYVLSILRIVTGLLFLEHATSKLFGFPATGFHPALLSIFGVAGVIELFGSLLLIFGLYTRPAAFILSGEMAVAYFLVDAPHSFYPLVNHGDPVILFCFVYLYIAAAGPGPWSLDHRRAVRAPGVASAVAESRPARGLD